MSDANVKNPHTGSSAACKGGAGGIWFLGFIGALCYYLHADSGDLLARTPGVHEGRGLARLRRLPHPDAQVNGKEVVARVEPS